MMTVSLILATQSFSNSSMDYTDRTTVALPANFMVWAASEQARFLRGKMVWANWDVTELVERKERIQGSLDLTSNILGWPFTPE